MNDLWIMRKGKWSWQEGCGSIDELKDHADLQNTNYRITRRVGRKADPSHPVEWERHYNQKGIQMPMKKKETCDCERAEVKYTVSITDDDGTLLDSVGVCGLCIKEAPTQRALDALGLQP